MKFTLLLSILYSTTIFSYFTTPTIDEILLLQEYRERRQEVRTLQMHLDELEKHPCIVKNDHYNECSKPFVLMQDLLEKVLIQQDHIDDLKSILFPYLDENDSILQTIEDALEDRFPLSEYCSSPPLAELIEQADSMLIFIQQLKKQNSYDRFIDISNAKKRDCDEDISSDCWKVDQYGNVFYVTKQQLVISSECLLRDSENRARPDQYSPEKIIQSANMAVEKLKSCFSELNPTQSQVILERIKSQDYYMMCKQNHDGSDNHRCGYTRRGQDYLNLVFNSKGCEGYEETIFHEILHMNSHIDNLQTHNHNRGECSRHDAVYFCSRECFPRSSRPTINFSQRACESCIKNPDERHRCNYDNLGTPTFNQSDMTCR